MSIKGDFKKILVAHKYYILLYLVSLYFLHFRDYYLNGKLSGLADFFTILPQSFVNFFAIVVTYWLWFFLLAIITIILLYMASFHVIQSLTKRDSIALLLSSIMIVGISILYSIFANTSLYYFGIFVMIAEILKYRSLRKSLIL